MLNKNHAKVKLFLMPKSEFYANFLLFSENVLFNDFVLVSLLLTYSTLCFSVSMVNCLVSSVH